MRRTTNRGRTAFTLVELLVVISIIAIMVGLLLGGIAKAYQQALNVNCQHNLGQLAKAVLAYSTAYRGSIPPTLVRKQGGTFVYWCNILAERDVDSQNMAVADRGQAGNADKVRTGQPSVFQCPATKETYVPAGGTSWSASNAWSTPPTPTDPLANGWYRLGNTDIMTDCSYYWNGYVGTEAQLVGRFPSEVLDLNLPDETAQARQIHDLSEIKMRSRMVMAADGVFFQGADPSGSGGGASIRPEYIAAARHPGTYAGGGVTNIAYYDGHVESMDRYPYPKWDNEQVDGFRYDLTKDPPLKESTDPTRPPLVPIMNKDLRTNLDLPPGDVKAGLGPVFLLPRR